MTSNIVLLSFRVAVVACCKRAAARRLRHRGGTLIRHPHLSGVLGALDRARELDACRDADLAEAVAQMGLDRLLAQEQLGRDLGVRLALDDEAGHLELALGERLDARPVPPAGAGAPMRTVAELPKLPLGLVAVAQRAAGVQRRCRALELRHGTGFLAGLGERPAGERA